MGTSRWWLGAALALAVSSVWLAAGCGSHGNGATTGAAGRGAEAGAAAGSAGAAGGGATGGATETPADALAFCTALHAAEVDRLVACAAGQRAPLAATYGQSWLCDGVVQAVAMGTATYDRGQAGACLDWLAHLPCGHALAQQYSAGPCELALVGQVADGGACTALDVDLDLSECARTSRCDTSMTCPGVCRPNVKLGQPCDPSTPCARGTYCGALHAGDPQTCVAIGGPGQSCDTSYGAPTRLLDPVGSADVCVEGYHCDLAQAVCVPEAPEDPCKRGETTCPNGACGLELAGVDPATGVTLSRSVCRPLSGDGGACAYLGTNQSYAYCPPGSTCTPGFTCVPLLGPGAACDPSLDSTMSCAQGFACGSSGACESVPPTAGGTCTHDLPCGHPGESCCYCPTCAGLFACGADATCGPSRTCVPN